MTTSRKRQLKALAIRLEIPLYAATLLLYAVAIALLVLVFPDVSNLWVSIFVLTSGFTSCAAATLSAIKSDDTTD